MTQETQQYTKREAIRQFGGDFLNALLDAIEKPSLSTLRAAFAWADDSNASRLEQAFPDLKLVLRQTYNEWPRSSVGCYSALYDNNDVLHATKDVIRIINGKPGSEHEFVLILMAFVCGVNDTAAREIISAHFPKACDVMKQWARWPAIADGICTAFPGLHNLDDVVDDPVQFTNGRYYSE